jgi:hypothetical protein
MDFAMLNERSLFLITDDLALGSSRAAVLQSAGISASLMGSAEFLRSDLHPEFMLICQSVSSETALRIAARQRQHGVVLRVAYDEEVLSSAFDEMVHCPVRPAALQALARNAISAPSVMRVH